MPTYINESTALKIKLKNIRFTFRNKTNIIVTKDGNRLGKRKYKLYLDLYFRSKQLSLHNINVNSYYGAYNLDYRELHSESDQNRDSITAAKIRKMGRKMGRKSSFTSSGSTL